MNSEFIYRMWNNFSVHRSDALTNCFLLLIQFYSMNRECSTVYYTIQCIVYYRLCTQSTLCIKTKLLNDKLPRILGDLGDWLIKNRICLIIKKCSFPSPFNWMFANSYRSQFGLNKRECLNVLNGHLQFLNCCVCVHHPPATSS